MKSYKLDFLHLCIDAGILRFGEFTLKSGRISPYFFNAGMFNTGGLLQAAANAYADLIADSINDSLLLYGPAYKGIPLAAATALQLQARHDRSVPYTFNRKEAKDHGEGGNLVGAELRGNVVIIDDVITAGTSVNESVDIIRGSGATLNSIVIALDRQEKAPDSDVSAVQRVQDTLGVPVYSILSLAELIEHASDSELLAPHAAQMTAYRDAYGVT
ncbi:MAG: orotate phosphoribosyltransferase [Pseudomonadota bacterium]